MEMYKGYTCVTFGELTDKTTPGAIISEANYKQHVMRKRINVVRSGKGMGNCALVDFDTLPARFKAAVVAKYGNPADVIRAQAKGDAVLIDTAARAWYAEHKLANGKHIDEDKQHEYTTTASILNEVIRQANATKARQKALGETQGITQQDLIMRLVEDFRLYPGHNLPTSWARLSKKIRTYKAEGYSSLIEGYLGNTNTQKICEEMGLQIVALKRSRTPKYTNAQIFVEINCIAQERGWKVIKSENTLVAFLNRPDIKQMWYDAVVGSKAAKYKYERKHRTLMPVLPNALWYGDGTKLNLYYRKWDESSRKWKMATTMVYEVMDAYTEVLLGYHISDTENYEAQCAAYRMAIETARCRPFEIVTDNQGGHKKKDSQGLLERIARVSRPTAPENAPAKSIESLFGRFQAQVLYKDWRFTGMNITAKGEYARPDLALIEANADQLYTLEELKEAYAKYRYEWNMLHHHKVAKPRMELYLSTQNPEALPLTQLDMVDIFWKQSDKELTFTQSGLTMTIDKKEYNYDVYNADGMPDLEFRYRNTYRKFVVKYDPQDMTTVRLYTADANGTLTFATEAEPYFEVHRALQEQQPGDMAFIRAMDEAKKQHRVDKQVEMVELEIAHGVAPEQHGLRRPKMSGISNKEFERLMDRPKPSAVEVPSEAQMHKVVSNTTHDEIIGKW